MVQTYCALANYMCNGGRKLDNKRHFIQILIRPAGYFPNGSFTLL